MYVYHGLWREDSREGISAATQSFSPHNLHPANYNKDKSAMALLKCFTSSSSNSTTFWFYFRELDCGHRDSGCDGGETRPWVCWRLFILRHRHSAPCSALQHPWCRYTKLTPGHSEYRGETSVPFSLIKRKLQDDLSCKMFRFELSFLRYYSNRWPASLIIMLLLTNRGPAETVRVVS